MYQKRVLRDLCSSINYGYTASASRDQVGPKFLRITDIAQSNLDWYGVPYCPIVEKDLGKYRLLTGDIVIARTGATAGWAKYIANPPPAVFASYLVRIRLSETTDARYVGHVVESKEYKDFVLQHAGGAAQPNANAQVLTSFELPVPPLPIQRRIASILSAYDDLIENHRKRIAILEEMARRLYREWFVHFRYPGHESVPLVDSSLGRIPQGWEALELRELFAISYGKTLPTSEISEVGEFPVYGAGGIIGRYDRCLQKEKCVLVTSRGNGSGTVWRTREAAFITNNSLVILPKTHLRGWEYPFVELLMKSSNVMAAKTGSAQPQVTIENLNYVKAIAPSNDLVVQFCRLATPHYDLVDLLEEQISVLRRTRDLLLPRLMSGTLSVEALATAEAAVP